MPWATAALDVMSDAIAGVIDSVGIHNGDPGAAGTANEVSGGGYSRQTPSWNAAGGDGEADLSATVSFSGPASQAVTHASFWDGATFMGAFALTGDLAFNAAGELNLTDATLPLTNP